MKDKFNRRINYLRVSITDRCNLRCIYCMPETGIVKKEHDDILSISELTSVAKIAVKLGIDKIRLTGGEPLVRKGVLHFVQELGKQTDLKDFAMTTNGLLLSEFAHELKNKGLKRVNISIDTLNPDKYKEITRGGNLDDALNGIMAAKSAGLYPIKINTVLMHGINSEDIGELINLANDKTVDEVRFIELMPLGETAGWSPAHFISNDSLIEQFNLKPLITGQLCSSPAEYYETEKGGKIGLISPISHKFCERCNRIRLTADGKIKLCLLKNDEFDIAPVVKNNPDILYDTLKEIIQSKPKEYDFDEGTVKRNMIRIGG